MACLNDQGAAEAQRLALVEQRDGRDAARAFASRSLRIYRQAVLNPRHFAATPLYRRRFIESYLEFKRYLARTA